MKFIFLKWRLGVNLACSDLTNCSEVLFNAKTIARKHSLELMALDFSGNYLQIHFYGKKSEVKLFVNDFRIGFCDYIKRNYKKDFSSALSDTYILRELNEDNPKLLECIKKEILIRNINKHLYADNLIGRKRAA